MNLAEIIAFFGFQANDFLSSFFALSSGRGREANIIMRIFARNVFTFALFKFGMATFLLFFAFTFLPHPLGEYLIYLDTFIEGIVVANNIYVLQKGGKNVRA